MYTHDMYMCIHIHTCTHACTCVYIHTHVHTHVHVYTYTHMYMCIHTHMYMCIRIHTCTHALTCVYIIHYTHYEHTRTLYTCQSDQEIKLFMWGKGCTQYNSPILDICGETMNIGIHIMYNVMFVLYMSKLTPHTES